MPKGGQLTRFENFTGHEKCTYVLCIWRSPANALLCTYVQCVFSNLQYVYVCSVYICCTCVNMYIRMYIHMCVCTYCTYACSPAEIIMICYSSAQPEEKVYGEKIEEYLVKYKNL